APSVVVADDRGGARWAPRPRGGEEGRHHATTPVTVPPPPCPLSCPAAPKPPLTAPARLGGESTSNRCQWTVVAVPVRGVGWGRVGLCDRGCPATSIAQTWACGARGGPAPSAAPAAAGARPASRRARRRAAQSFT